MKKQAQKQMQMFEYEDLPLFSQTPMEVQDEAYQPVKIVKVEGQTVEQAIEALPFWYREAAKAAQRLHLEIMAYSDLRYDDFYYSTIADEQGIEHVARMIERW